MEDVSQTHPGVTPDPVTMGILVASKDQRLTENLRSWLEPEEGYSCCFATSVEKTLSCLAGGDYALMLLDMAMEGACGKNLIPKVKADFPDLRIIILGEVKDWKRVVRTLELGAFSTIPKPLERRDVVVSVACVMQKCQEVLANRGYQDHLEVQLHQHIARVKSLEEEIAIRLGRAADYRDEETGRHVRQVGEFAAALAAATNWPPERIEDLRLAAPMHDIGKVGTPDHILLKPGKLSPADFDVAKKHAEIGAKLLGGSDIPVLQMAHDIALFHHEWWDGTGYPQALSGTDIPECARLVAIVDVYDILLHERPYRPAMPEQAAIEIMTEECGTHFDPRMFSCFTDILPQLQQIQLQVENTENGWQTVLPAALHGGPG